MACLLDLTPKTAETHRSNIRRKLNLQSVSELVLFAVRNGIIQVPTNAIEDSVINSRAQVLVPGPRAA